MTSETPAPSRVPHIRSAVACCGGAVRGVAVLRRDGMADGHRRRRPSPPRGVPSESQVDAGGAGAGAEDPVPRGEVDERAAGPVVHDRADDADHLVVPLDVERSPGRVRGVPDVPGATRAARARRAPAGRDAAAAPAEGAGPGGDCRGCGPAPRAGRRVPSHRRRGGGPMGAPARRPRHEGDVHARRRGVDRGERESSVARRVELLRACRAERRTDLLGDHGVGCRRSRNCGHSPPRPTSGLAPCASSGAATAPGRTARRDSR